MKPSKKQQEIIDKMRQGYIIRYYGGTAPAKLSGQDGGFTVVETVPYPTFSKLCDLGAVRPENHTDYPRTYILTEKFKSDQEDGKYEKA